MRHLQLKVISERGMELFNLSTTVKLVKVGKMAGLCPGVRVIDFESGYGEVLAKWAVQFGISGVGIELRETVCQRAKQKMIVRHLSEQLDGLQSAM